MRVKARSREKFHRSPSAERKAGISMSITLKVTPSELTAAAAEIENAVDSLRAGFEEADRIVTSCAAFWEGEASEKHKEMYRELKEGMDEALLHIREHPQKLLRMSGVYTDAEDGSAGIAGALGSSVL